MPTLERGLYAYRSGGLHALRPRGRSVRGCGRALSDELRQLLCDIRREYPSASAQVIVRTLEADGRLEYVGYASSSPAATRPSSPRTPSPFMHEHTTGALRNGDRIARGAMRDSARRKRKTVDREAIERVLADRMPIA